MIPQLKPAQGAGRRFTPKRPQSPAEIIAGEVARRVLEALGLKNDYPTWRKVRDVVLGYVEPGETRGEEEAQ